MDAENSKSPGTSQVYIITGMGRSGTSLITNFLQSAGVHTGDRVPQADSHNEHGYFEDLDFINFHEKILIRNGLNYFANPSGPITLTAEEISGARELVKRKSIRQSWGWKDPRASFFLDFWHSEIPNAKFIFLYRHPIEVFLSQLKSHMWTASPSEIFDAWVAYNERILKFFLQNREGSILCNIHGLLYNIDKFENLLKIKFALDSTISKDLYHSQSLHCLTIPESVKLVFAQKFSRIADIYCQMQKAADIPLAESTNVSNDNISAFAAYICDVLNTVYVSQTSDHKKLWLQHQQLKSRHEQLANQYKELLASETYLMAKKIQNSFLMKLWQSISKR